MEKTGDSENKEHIESNHNCTAIQANNSVQILSLWSLKSLDIRVKYNAAVKIYFICLRFLVHLDLEKDRKNEKDHFLTC